MLQIWGKGAMCLVDVEDVADVGETPEACREVKNLCILCLETFTKNIHLLNLFMNFNLPFSWYTQKCFHNCGPRIRFYFTFDSIPSLQVQVYTN